MAPVRYQSLSIAQKQAADIARVREPPVTCPSCETRTTPADLLAHVAHRCPGPRDPGPAAVWVGWRDATRLGILPPRLTRMVARGEVRVRGERGDRRYLLRDLAIHVAIGRIRMRPVARRRR